MNPEDIQVAIETNDYKTISDKLYRVQKLAGINYMFRHHLETQIIDDASSKAIKRFIIIQSLGALFSLKPFKLHVD